MNTFAAPLGSRPRSGPLTRPRARRIPEREQIALLEAGFDQVHESSLTRTSREHLVLRLEALVRRSWQLPLPRRFQIGGITVDERRSSVETPDGVFVLPRAELKVLSLLVQRMGSVVRRAEFHTVLAGEDGSYSSNALESVLKRIRSQLPALKPRLQTVWGRGYRLAPAGE